MHSAPMLRVSDFQDFKNECKRLGLDHVEELDMHIRQNWAVGDRASSPDSPYVKNVFGDQANSANLVNRTQDPPLGIGNKLPGDSLIMIIAAAAVVRLSDADEDGDPLVVANLKSIQKDLDRSILQSTLGGSRIFEVYGKDFMDFGPSSLAGANADADDNGFLTTVDRKVRVFNAPRILGTEQTWTMSHSVERQTDWPIPFVADYVFPVLLGRKR